MSCTLINTSKLPTHARARLHEKRRASRLLTNHHNYAYLKMTQLNTFLCIASQKGGCQFTF